jgi:multiple sugar transport system permease protein/sn-glycerol 3-phosphate transport system permease protein
MAAITPTTKDTGLRLPHRKQAVAGLIMLLPMVILSLAFEYWPSLRSLQMMFYEWNLVSENTSFVGLDNFRTVLNDDRFITSIKNTVIYAGILAPIQIMLPLGIALVLRPLAKSRMSPIYRGLLFLPMVISLPAAAVVWLWMLNPLNGIVNQILMQVGMDRINWLNEPGTAMGSVIVVAAWSSVGFNVLLYLMALEGIPKDVQEAARLDGSSDWQVFRHIEWKLISPVFFFIVLTTILFVNNDIFGVINIMTKGGPYSSTTNVLYYLYERGFKFFQAGEASALAVSLVVVYLLMSWLQFRFGERKVHYGS